MSSVTSDREGVEQVFKRFDTNNDGTMSLKELRDFLAALNVDEVMLRKKHVVALFHLINADKTEHITFEEFYKWWQLMAKTHFTDLETKMRGISHLYKYFTQFDKDQTGALSQEEFKQMYNALELQSSNKPVEDFVKELDSNGDNAITYHEIAKLLGYC
jgi:Ca2+-binding EF-hand superfamily protein